MGLPGSGKTTLAGELYKSLDDSLWLNADVIRKTHDDWDFSPEGRIRQANRMTTLSRESKNKYVICDFVAALKEQRTMLNPDFVIWMDTINKGRFEDTNAAFTVPDVYDLRVTNWEYDITSITHNIISSEHQTHK